MTALDQTFVRLKTNLSNTASDVGRVINKTAAPVSNFVKLATNLVSPNKQTNTPSLNYKVNDIQQKQSPIVKNFIQTAQKGIQNWAIKNPARATNIVKIPDAIQTYGKEVEYNKQNPFFNKQNTPVQWAGKVVKEFQQRGPYEGIHGLTNPVLMNPYIEPVAARVVSNLRVNNYKAGRPNDLANNILGQTDAIVKRQDEANVKGKDYGPEIYDNPVDQIVATELKNTNSRAPITTPKPVDKKKVGAYINKWSGQDFTNPENTNRLVEDMFMTTDFSPIHYWNIYKTAVPNAKPSDFINAIKQVFLTQNGK